MHYESFAKLVKFTLEPIKEFVLSIYDLEYFKQVHLASDLERMQSLVFVAQYMKNENIVDIKELNSLIPYKTLVNIFNNDCYHYSKHPLVLESFRLLS